MRHHMEMLLDLLITGIEVSHISQVSFAVIYKGFSSRDFCTFFYYVFKIIILVNYTSPT